LEYLLFTGYLILFAWLVTRVKFFTLSGLTKPQLVIFLLLKVIAGIFYGWIGVYYGGLAQMIDTWGFHANSILEYKLLFSNPGEYFTNLFHNPYGGGVEKFLSTTDSYWNDVKGNFFIKVLSVFNIFSQGHYYINVIFYSFITLFGPIAIYRVMKDVYPGKQIPVLVATFLIPSFLYWTSGLHKEGLIFMGIALIVFTIYFGLKENKISFKSVFLVILCLLILLVLRNFLFVLIIPAAGAWLLAGKFPKRSLGIFLGIYVICIVLFFTLRYISPSFDFPAAVVDRQKSFSQLQGGSAVPIKKLESGVISFIKSTPQAINLSTIRPYPSDVKHILSLAAAVEINILLLLFVICLFIKTNVVKSRPLIYFCLFFSFSVLLSIGYTVNFLGAIVRYRSVVIPLLVIPMIASIDWERINNFLFKNIKKNNNVLK
jgi:hypothetical protein